MNLLLENKSFMFFMVFINTAELYTIMTVNRKQLRCLIVQLTKIKWSLMKHVGSFLKDSLTIKSKNIRILSIFSLCRFQTKIVHLNMLPRIQSFTDSMVP